MRFTMQLLLMMLLISADIQADPQEISLTLSDDNEIILQQYNTAKTPYLLLWVASAYGFQTAHQHSAELLAQSGFEVWQVDLLESLFMTRSVHNMRTLSGHYVAELVELIYQRTGKTIFLMGDQSAAMPIMHGAHAWQVKHPQVHDLGGLLLFSPSLYLQVPQLGEEAGYLPVVSDNRLPIFIFQAQADGNRWHLPKLLRHLYKGGGQVYAEMMPGVRSLFAFEHRIAIEDQTLQRLPQKLQTRLPLLLRNRRTISTPPHAFTQLPELKHDSGVDIHLKPYRGKAQATPLSLLDVNSHPYQLKTYAGQVTIVNFWASWCPPCVAEIPSLNRLREQMSGQNFQLISINYAETSEAILQFMQQVSVDFPVLMDTDGQVAAQWKVFAFPSTFVIDAQGQIRYGINAGIEWDTPEVTRILNGLLTEPRTNEF